MKNEAKFKSGDKLWATAIQVNSMVFPVEVIIATKTKKQLVEAICALSCDCDPAKFKRIVVTTNKEQK